MRARLVRLRFGPERCCGVIVSPAHILTSAHQLNGATAALVDDGTPQAPFRGRVVDCHGAADLAIVAVASAKPSWTPQQYGGGSRPPFGHLVGLAGFSVGEWSNAATCLATTSAGLFVVDCQPLTDRSVPCIGDSGSPAWSGNTVVGICSAPVLHAPGCNGAQMRYTFIDDGLARWIDRALTTSLSACPDAILSARRRHVRTV